MPRKKINRWTSLMKEWWTWIKVKRVIIAETILNRRRMIALRGRLWVLFPNLIAKEVNWNVKEAGRQIKLPNNEILPPRAELKTAMVLNPKTLQIHECSKARVIRELSKKTPMRITKPTTMKMITNQKMTRKGKIKLSLECWLGSLKINKCLLKKCRVMMKKVTVSRNKNLKGLRILRNTRSSRKRKTSLTTRVNIEMMLILLRARTQKGRRKRRRMMLNSCRLLKIRCLILLKTFSTWLPTVCKDKN